MRAEKENPDRGKKVCWVRAWGAAVLRPYMSLLETPSFIAEDVLEAALLVAEGLDGVEFGGAGGGV